MKNLTKLIPHLAVILLMASCTKHVIELDSVKLPENMAEFQLHYFVPVTAVAANNITKVEVNDIAIVDSTSTLVTYNAVPSGAVGRFFAAPSGKANIKLYRGASKELVYNQEVNFIAGKQNIFVHDFNKPPVIISNGYPYPKNTTVITDTTAWVKFYNFLYETAGVPTTLKLQYQYQYTYYTKNNNIITSIKSDWLNLGKPVAFGEATGWEPVPVIKHPDREISAGSERIDYRIKVIGDNNTDLGLLQVRNASGAFVNYADFWNAAIGRVYHHIFSGFRAATPTSAVRTFTAL
ncbi:hypothetical protein U0035_16780 [Niabella yanshanensis]|uniref:DUF4249 domain-containing protein n=1 Tax=Niabella yanshanensis TaxID=577386 RepID=A0ABZ0W231_9BACT|nr:hypothetical protein [Niabella yanshanensis]WQD37325.1 hypothetical protein U0035_16780 [Niabella yanshanensis]